MTAATDELSTRARFLRNAAPQPFQDFLAAFANYTDRKFVDLVDATDNFQNVQGHAQQCKAILKVLEGVRNG